MENICFQNLIDANNVEYSDKYSFFEFFKIVRLMNQIFTKFNYFKHLKNLFNSFWSNKTYVITAKKDNQILALCILVTDNIHKYVQLNDHQVTTNLGVYDKHLYHNIFLCYFCVNELHDQNYNNITNDLLNYIENSLQNNGNFAIYLKNSEDSQQYWENQGYILKNNHLYYKLITKQNN